MEYFQLEYLDKSPLSISKASEFFDIDTKFLTASAVSTFEIIYFLFPIIFFAFLISSEEFTKDNAKYFIPNFLQFLGFYVLKSK